MNGALTSGMRGLTCLLLPVLALGCALPNPTQGEKESNADSPSYGLSAMAAPREPHARWLQRLALSDGQLRRLRNIVHDALGMTEPMLDQVRPLLSAAVVDEGQLQAALTRVMRQDAVQDAMTLEQIRLTLTPAQRLQVAHGISHFAGSHRMVFERMLDRFAAETGSSLDLSVAQREALDKLVMELKSAWKSTRTAFALAMAEHLRQGGQADLQRTLEALNATFDPGPTVQFLASLDQGQRRQAMGQLDRLRLRLALGFYAGLVQGARLDRVNVPGRREALSDAGDVR